MPSNHCLLFAFELEAVFTKLLVRMYALRKKLSFSGRQGGNETLSKLLTGSFTSADNFRQREAIVVESATRIVTTKGRELA